ncbi:Predicted Fe-Mo cluster-binding protein, NifX family [Desulfacinum infernum DSM 9756]|uniref:Predicted Fe-Mo cluster-binding protein, NifX family n=1 Tax=Desulfacinum infernum DSM 9756 TaxID=1121391 RepID=A0A1M5BCM7_9BACT|nr:NifB/NifX family molybdenum-iron cluster-binding protein [Desulfacinum infernum]SHF40178.1 Predicted Fe-Mo cluster-binding protein, NifX family [Desulfacinum infernum DSM 9756]
MRICFPVSQEKGWESPVFGHFGSAPAFVIVDTDSGQLEEVTNGDLHHAHGMCQPLKALGGRQVDGVAVGGIGMGALMKLQAQGITVYRAVEGTVKDNLAMLKEGKLPVFSSDWTCAGHGHAGGCAHR